MKDRHTVFAIKLFALLGLVALWTVGACYLIEFSRAPLAARLGVDIARVWIAYAGLLVVVAYWQSRALGRLCRNMIRRHSSPWKVTP